MAKLVKKWVCPKVKHDIVKRQMLAQVGEWISNSQITAADLPLLDQAANFLDDYYTFREDVQERGPVVKGPRGETANPSIKAMRDSWNSYMDIVKECGLTRRAKKILKSETEANAPRTELEEALDD